MASSMCKCFTPVAWMYSRIMLACSGMWLFFYLCFQWIRRMLSCSSRRERQNSLTDIRAPDNVDIGEYDVLDHEQTTRSNLEETVAYNTNSNISQESCLCPNSESHPICIPRRKKPKKERYDAFRTSSMCSTLEAEDKYHTKTFDKFIKEIIEDELSMSSRSSSSSEESLIFNMSPVT